MHMARGVVRAAGCLPAPALTFVEPSEHVRRHAAACRDWNGSTAAAWTAIRADAYRTAGFRDEQATMQAWIDWEAARLTGGDVQELARFLDVIFQVLRQDLSAADSFCPDKNGQSEANNEGNLRVRRARHTQRPGTAALCPHG
jgi:hypothetical protein